MLTKCTFTLIQIKLRSPTYRPSEKIYGSGNDLPPTPRAVARQRERQAVSL